MGVGAIAAALTLGAIRVHVSSHAVLTLAAVIVAVAVGVLALVTSVNVAVPVLIACGFGWTATVSTTVSELQLFLPDWVRARVLAIFLMVFVGLQSVMAPVWGLAAQHAGLPMALGTAAGLAVIGATGGSCLRVPEMQNIDRSARRIWEEPDLRFMPDPASGPIVVSVEYVVAEDQVQAFLATTADLRRSRLRSGACAWGIYRVGEDPRLFVEQFTVPTWHEHQQQHAGRLTLDDEAIADATFARVVGVSVRHLLPATP